MKPYTWHEGMSLEDTKNLAYWERNMLALMFAVHDNEARENFGFKPKNGWYTHGEWEGWSRIISLFDGEVTFHVPDDFDLGDLPKIEPNWDGHTTEEKWQGVVERCGCVGDNYA